MSTGSRSKMGERSALVTGAHGFTGRYLCQSLRAKGYRVSEWTHHKDSDDPSAVCVDLVDADAVRCAVGRTGPDVVVHLAAISFPAHGDAGEIYQSNILGTRNLLAALADTDHKPGVVLLASSANVYGDSTPGKIDESAVLAPKNDYAVSKIAMEYLARIWQDRLPVVIARPFNYTGVGQAKHFLIPKIVDHFVRKQAVIELGNLDVARDFSDVRGVVSSYLSLLTKGTPGEVYNVCSGIPISLQEVLRLMSEIAGYTIVPRVNPDFVRDNEVKVLLGNNERLAKTIGPLPSYPFEETLRWMYMTAQGRDVASQS